MPRLTYHTYLYQREYLREAWTFDQRAFSLLAPKEQWDLHAFYAVTQEMTDAELRLHRWLVKQVDPSLPQRAGRAYAKLERGDWKRISYAVTPKGRAITIRTVVKPKPDLERYARAVLAVAMERQGLAPSWARPQLDALLAEYGSDGRVGDTKTDTKPGK